MPVRRAKACSQCRKAKARCSLATPCSRCATRRLDCHYLSPLPRLENRWREGFRSIRPAKDSSAPDHPSAKKGPPGSLPEIPARAHHKGSVTLTKDEGPMLRRHADLEADGSFGSTNDPTEYETPELPAYPYFTSSTFRMPESFDISQAMMPTASYNTQIPGTTSANLSPCDMISPRLLNLDDSFEIPGFPSPLPTESTPNTKNHGPQLSQRPRSLQQGSLTGKMIFSRLRDYSRMMADAKTLPPFIFPPCCLGPDDECPPDASHGCLPEPLAVCSNLTQMFYTRMPGSQGFVWIQIYAHIRQMREEYETYSEKMKLSSLQSALVYGMLCAQCTESMSVEDSTWIVSTIEGFAEELYDLGTWGLAADSLCSTRSQWVLVETLRRIGCLLYLFDLLLQVDTQTPSAGDCPEFFDMPLPCHRDLWEPISDRDWKKRHQQYVESRKQNGRQGLTLGKLLLLRQSAAHGQDSTKAERPGFVEELAEWCENVDDLSMLLWMAITVEGEGQSQLYRLGISPAMSL